MAYLPGFVNDVFISYTHRDNLSASANDVGWVRGFHLYLHKRLTELLGDQAAIWRDEKKLGGADNFDDEILTQLRSSAVLVPIVSPGYLKSTYCQRELEEFQNAAMQVGGLQVGNLFRAVKAVKTPLEGDRHRELLGQSLGYEFYLRELNSTFFEEFKPSEKCFETLIDRLAQDIKRILDEMTKARTTKCTVYLAETSLDLNKKERQKIKDELQSHGYHVLPNKPLPDEATELCILVQAALKEAKLAIFLTGAPYAKIPESADQSIVEIQFELAQRNNCPRMVWIKPGEEEGNKYQEEFLESLRQHSQSGLDLLEHKPIEDLQELVLTRLAPKEVEAMPKLAGDRLVRVYLVCDHEDHPLNQAVVNGRHILALRDYLYEAGFEVKLPVSRQTAAPSRQKDNREKLKKCDAVLLFWGHASQVWVEERLAELNKALGWRKAKPFVAKALYMTEPDEPAKRIYKTREAQVMTRFGSFSPETLDSFLRDLRQKLGHS